MWWRYKIKQFHRTVINHMRAYKKFIGSRKYQYTYILSPAPTPIRLTPPLPPIQHFTLFIRPARHQRRTHSSSRIFSYRYSRKHTHIHKHTLTHTQISNNRYYFPCIEADSLRSSFLCFFFSFPTSFLHIALLQSEPYIQHGYFCLIVLVFRIIVSHIIT